MSHVPFCGAVPIVDGSVEVFAIAIPVSKPAPAKLVTNGNNRYVWQITMVSRFLAVEVSANRGMVSVDEAADPAAALNAIGGVGAKLWFTVAVPGGGELLPGLAVNAVNTPKLNV